MVDPREATSDKLAVLYDRARATAQDDDAVIRRHTLGGTSYSRESEVHSRLIRINRAPDGTCRDAIALAHVVLTSIDALAATSEEACTEPILIPPVGTSKPPVTGIGDEEVER